MKSDVKGSLSNLPKHIDQIQKHKSLQLKSQELLVTKDEIYNALLNRKKSDFVRLFRSCFIQLSAIFRFNAVQTGDKFWINVDTTFNLDQFYVTVMTYKNLSLIEFKIKKHPTFIGPVMIHTIKTKTSILKLPFELLSFGLKMRQI